MGNSALNAGAEYTGTLISSHSVLAVAYLLCQKNEMLPAKLPLSANLPTLDGLFSLLQH